MARRSYKGSKRPRIRRIYIKRRGHKMKKVGLFDLVGLGVGLGMSAFGPKGSDFMYFKQDPVGQTKYALNGIVAGVTGYDMINHDWSAGNLEFFWVPMISFHIADWLMKKLGFNHVKIFRNIRLA